MDLDKSGLPPIIVRFLKVARQIILESRKDNAGCRIVKAAFMVLLVGISVFLPSKTPTDQILPIALTVLSIMAGFLFSLLLLTGSTETLNKFDHRTTEIIVRHVKFLLRFQILTFVIYFFTIISGLFVLFLEHYWARYCFEVMFYFGLIWSVFRSFLIPFQMYEHHELKLNKTMDFKNDEAHKAWLAKKEQLRKDRYGNGEMS